VFWPNILAHDSGNSQNKCELVLRVQRGKSLEQKGLFALFESLTLNLRELQKTSSSPANGQQCSTPEQLEQVTFTNRNQRSLEPRHQSKS